MDSDNPTPTPNRVEVQWPERPQIIRQTVTLSVAIIGWSMLFWAAMTIPGSFAQDDSAAERRRAAATQQTPTDSAATAVAGTDADSADTDGSEDAPVEEAPAQVAQTPPPAADPEPDPAPADPTPAEEQPTQVATQPPVSPPTEQTPPPASTGTTSDADVPLDEITLDDPLDAAIDEDLGEVSFAADILPIMESRCIECHGGMRDDGTQRIEEGLSLLTVEDILAGSTWGSVVEPGDVAGSYLYEVVESGDMPDNAPRLLPRELRLIAAWIRQGAPAN
ncbi:c-type cytochrome domain-containing protein [Gaopeijia maritima]|uniref:c-type cytochrome domain-containing protein n=1 Tax=Gaopeijia maritima TaxID=3119007 RepID=UPI00324303AA